MMQTRRCFGVILKSGGKLQLVGFFSSAERKAFCEDKTNKARPITMEQWKKIPSDLKA